MSHGAAELEETSRESLSESIYCLLNIADEVLKHAKKPARVQASHESFYMHRQPCETLHKKVQ